MGNKPASPSPSASASGSAPGDRAGGAPQAGRRAIGSSNVSITDLRYALTATNRLPVPQLIEIVVLYATPIPLSVCTIAGSGESGFADSVGTEAWLDRPQQNVLFASGGAGTAIDTLLLMERYRIRKLDIKTHRVSSLPIKCSTFLTDCFGIAIEPATNAVLFTDPHSVHRFDGASGETTHVAGSVPGYTDGSGKSALFKYARGIAVSPDGSHAVVCDCWNDALRRIELNPQPRGGERLYSVSTIAQRKEWERLSYPELIAFDDTGAVMYITAHHRILAFDSRSGLRELAVSGIADFDPKSLLFVSSIRKLLVSHLNGLYAIDPITGVHTLVLTSPNPYTEISHPDGTKSRGGGFSTPTGIALLTGDLAAPLGAADGRIGDRLYVCDVVVHSLRLVTGSILSAMTQY